LFTPLTLARYLLMGKKSLAMPCQSSMGLR
jgi:hypothetical protein